MRPTAVTPFTRLRTLAATMRAIAVGLTNVVLRREPASAVVLAPGDLAPDFALEGSDGRTYRLDEVVRTRAVVIAWFPKAFTGGCTTECASIGASRGAIRTFDAAYFGASVDTSAVNREFAASLGLDFPILSDPSKTTARAYGVLGPSGLPSRWTFYIGVGGRILAIDKAVHTASHGADIAAALERLNVRRET
jgi:peroxiredoxin Q/BCP